LAAADSPRTRIIVSAKRSTLRCARKSEIAIDIAMKTGTISDTTGDEEGTRISDDVPSVNRFIVERPKECTYVYT